MQIFLLSLFFFTHSDSLSQDSAILKNYRLNEINITAQRLSTSWIESCYSLITKTSAEIKNSLIRSTPDAILTNTNIFVQKTNHGGGSAIIRGLMGNQTLLVIDGVRMNNSTYRYGPNQYLNTVDPFSLERIEIVSGSGAVQYGSDALGGVIHLMTHKTSAKPGLSGTILLRGTSQNMEQTGRAQINYKRKNWEVYSSVGLRKFGDLYGGKNIGPQSPSGYKEEMNTTKIQYTVGDNTFTLSNQFFKAIHVPVYHKIKLENFKINEMHPQRRNLSYLKHHYIGKSKWMNEINTLVSIHQSLESRISQKNNTIKLQTETDKILTTNFSSSITSSWSKRWQSSTGIEYYHDQVHSDKTVLDTDTKQIISQRGLYPDGARYTSLSAFSLHKVSLHHWLFSGGMRWNQNQITIDEEILGLVNINPMALIFNLNTGYRINQNNTIYAAYNNGFRAPNIDDMGTLGIVDFRYEIPVSNLKPEKSKSIEFGYKTSSTHHKIGLSLFQNQLTDLITRIKTNDKIGDYFVYKKSNIDKAVISGIEMDVDWLVKYFTINSNLTYTYGKNKITGEPLRRIPPLFGNLSLKYGTDKFYIKSEYLMAGAQHRLSKGDIDDNRIGPQGTPAWNAFNLYGSTKIKNLTFQVLCQNIFNEAYKYHGSGIYAPGRSATIQIQYDF